MFFLATMILLQLIIPGSIPVKKGSIVSKHNGTGRKKLEGRGCPKKRPLFSNIFAPFSHDPWQDFARLELIFENFSNVRGGNCPLSPYSFSNFHSFHIKVLRRLALHQCHQ